jgi:hypothetical protein
VIGVDQCQAYVTHACREVAERKASCEFHVDDAFTFLPAPTVDAVVNWGSSFGNADDNGWQDSRHGTTQLYPGQVGAFDPGHTVTFAE